MLRPLLRRGASWALIAILAWTAASAVAEHFLLHPFRWDPGPTPAARGWVYDDVSFRSADGVSLRGWWIPGASHRTIVMVHGWTSSRREPYDKSAYLHDAGYNLLVFDLRGSGRSGGGITTLGLKEPLDVRAAIDFAKSRDAGPLALFGYSMGAATVVETAAGDSRVAAVVEDSGYASLDDVVAAGFSRLTHLPLQPFGAAMVAAGQLDIGAPMSHVQPVDAAARLTQPLLAIVGTADQVVPPAQGYRLFAATQTPKQLLVVPGAGHTRAYYVEPAVYTQTVLRFLAVHLPAA